MLNNWLSPPSKTIDTDAIQVAEQHQLSLTKPAGSLGQLESIAIKFSGWQRSYKPSCDNILVRVFAGDHGVCAQGVSAFPQEVTAQMVVNFLSGGAAISVLSKRLGADFAVINMGTATPMQDMPGLINAQVAEGSADFTQAPAMSVTTLSEALQYGREQLLNNTADLFIGGDMGIGNTTAASAIYSLLLDLPASQTVGPGTGVDSHGISRKQSALDTAFALHADKLNSPLDVLQHVGGLEIAALVGAYITAAQQGIPILVDGFITTAAALLAVQINPSVRDWMLFSHQSAEPAHVLALESLNATPLLNLGLRLGEGSGSAIAVPIIQDALALHNSMATFSSAGVSDN